MCLLRPSSAWVPISGVCISKQFRDGYLFFLSDKGCIPGKVGTYFSEDCRWLVSLGESVSVSPAPGLRWAQFPLWVLRQTALWAEGGALAPRAFCFCVLRAHVYGGQGPPGLQAHGWCGVGQGCPCGQERQAPPSEPPPQGQCSIGKRGSGPALDPG